MAAWSATVDQLCTEARFTDLAPRKSGRTLIGS